MDLLDQVHQRVDGAHRRSASPPRSWPRLCAPAPWRSAGSRRWGRRPPSGSPRRGCSPAPRRSGRVPRGRGDAPSQRSISRPDPQRSRLRGPPHAATSPIHRCRPRRSDRRSFPTQCKADGGSLECKRISAGALYSRDLSATADKLWARLGKAPVTDTPIRTNLIPASGSRFPAGAVAGRVL